MASNIVKLSAAVIAGSVIGVTYGTRSIRINNLDTHVLANSSLTPPLPPNMPIDRSNKLGQNFIDIDPKVSAENFMQSSRFGLPSKDNLRVFNDFILSYDRRLRSPIWVLEHLKPEKLNTNNGVTRKNSKFVEDITLHEYFRATSKDFFKSQLDRGHMAAAANHKLTQMDMDQTFVLSNISPQEHDFNAGGWERLESYVRWLAGKSKNLYVVTGPLYLPQKSADGNMYVTYRVIGDNMVSVPTHHFKVILVEKNNQKLMMEAFLMPNDSKLTADIKLDDYRVPISRLDIIERASGVIFFDSVLRNKIETPTRIPSDFKPRIYDNRKSKLPASG